MARIKVYQPDQAIAEYELGKANPLRRTRRRTRSRVEHLDASTSDVEDAEEVESIRAPSPLPSPVAKPKLKRKYRKSNVTKASPSPEDDPSPEPTPQLAKDGRRKGGNKRKWTHEYCLTCTNYGRACGGRREGEPGCAVCREPNKEKGEKLRECLWADPDAGITTYKEAREKHKRAQAEARQQKVKIPKRTAQVVNLIYAPPIDYLAAQDPLGIVAYPRAAEGSRPTLSRPLDLRPPSHPTGEAPPPSMNGIRSYLPSAIQQPFAEDIDTITVNISPTASHKSHPNIPGVHPPQVINLSNEDESSEQIRRASMPDPVHYFQPPKLPLGLAPLPESFAPYYEPRQRAYILPVYPHSNLLPPPAFMRDHAATYISPYDAHPSIPLSMTGKNPPRAVFPTEIPPASTAFNVPPPLKLRSRKSQPLDRSGTPCRKWSMSDSKVTTLSGYDFKAKGWKLGADGSGTGETPCMASNVSNAVSSNAVSIGDDARKSVDSSELSSAVDIDERMRVATPEHGEQVEDVERGPGNKNNATLDQPQRNRDETETDNQEEDTDRAQAFLNQLWKEKVSSGAKRKRSPSPEAEASPTARFIAVNKDYVSDDNKLTESEGEEKVMPVNARDAAGKVVASDNSFRTLSSVKSKVSSGRDRTTRPSTSSNQHEDAAEEPVRVNAFAAVNSKSRKHGATSLERKRKILAGFQTGDVEMD